MSCKKALLLSITLLVVIGAINNALNKEIWLSFFSSLIASCMLFIALVEKD